MYRDRAAHDTPRECELGRAGQMHESVWHWLSRLRTGKGQGLVEFTFVVPVFLLFVFGIIQVALIYHAYSAVQQAASDAVYATAAQGDKDTPDGIYWHSDQAALAAAEHAMSTLNLNQVTSLQIFSAVTADTPLTRTVTEINDQAVASTVVTLSNTYVPAQGATTCNVDGDFKLSNALTLTGRACELPWNGQPYDPDTNQNGRNAVRCLEERADVRIVYQFKPLPFFPAFKLQLVGDDSTSLEPTTYLKDASYTVGVTSC